MNSAEVPQNLSVGLGEVYLQPTLAANLSNCIFTQVGENYSYIYLSVRDTIQIIKPTLTLIALTFFF